MNGNVIHVCDLSIISIYTESNWQSTLYEENNQMRNRGLLIKQGFLNFGTINILDQKKPLLWGVVLYTVYTCLLPTSY